MPAGSGQVEKQPTHEQNEWVKELRRRLLHHLIAQVKTPVATNTLLKLVTEDGRWPEAHWGGARKGDPDAQQVRNYVAVLRKQGKVEYVDYQGWRSILAPEPLEKPLRKRAADALRLQAEGKTGIEIAEVLEISRSLAYSLINDPYGDEARERKKAYCPVCGTKLDGSVDWCRKCKTEKAENLLPTPDYLAVIQRVRREQRLDMVMGVTYDCERVIRIATGRGVLEHKLARNESWDDALEELGLL